MTLSKFNKYAIVFSAILGFILAIIVFLYRSYKKTYISKFQIMVSKKYESQIFLLKNQIEIENLTRKQKIELLTNLSNEILLDMKTVCNSDTDQMIYFNEWTVEYISQLYKIEMYIARFICDQISNNSRKCFNKEFSDQFVREFELITQNLIDNLNVNFFDKNIDGLKMEFLAQFFNVIMLYRNFYEYYFHSNNKKTIDFGNLLDKYLLLYRKKYAISPFFSTWKTSHESIRNFNYEIFCHIINLSLDYFMLEM